MINRAILLTFDVEDWFQVENFKEYIPFDSWNSHELRVEKNTTQYLIFLIHLPLNQKQPSSSLAGLPGTCQTL